MDKEALQLPKSLLLYMLMATWKRVAFCYLPPIMMFNT
jgi:hypothetical protein